MIYPEAIQHPLPDHFAPGNLADKNTIVLHITMGHSAASAIATFAASKAPPEGKGRVSAHFVINRDGAIYQCVDVKDVAWHASQCNTHSVGVEHAATTDPEWAATDAQYVASARLISWLCGQLTMPVDRTHIRTHNEASPRDGHVLCCTGGLDPDRLVAMAVEYSA